MAKGKKCLTLKSTVRTLSLKFYLEQMTETLEELKERVKNMPKEKYQGLGIVHDKDYQCDSYWEPSIEKLHIHIIIRVLNGKTTQVDTILNMLKIQYRPEIDDILWQNHGAETCADFTAMAMYLTHETEQAILDGKHKYDITEVFSNLTQEEIEEVRQGYIRFSNGLGKKSFKDLAEIDEFAYNLGTIYGNFDEWYNSLDFGFRSNTKIKTIRESYYRGVDVSFNKNDTINRLCIFIEGEKNTGKTYASKQALKGKRILEISGGGTGKYDKLQASTEAILLSDDTSSSLLNMTDNYPCRAYKRQSNNPIWAGQYFIVTSNLSFCEWLEVCGFKKLEHVNAMESRFFICHIEKQFGHNTLVCENVSTRGNQIDQQEKINMFVDFKRRFNKSLAEYQPETIKVEQIEKILSPMERMKARIKRCVARHHDKEDDYSEARKQHHEQILKEEEAKRKQQEYDLCGEKTQSLAFLIDVTKRFTENFETLTSEERTKSYEEIAEKNARKEVKSIFGKEEQYIIDSQVRYMIVHKEQIIEPLLKNLFSALMEEYTITNRTSFNNAIEQYNHEKGLQNNDILYCEEKGKPDLYSKYNTYIEEVTNLEEQI